MKVVTISLLAAISATHAGPSLAGDARLRHADILALLTGASVESTTWSQTFEKGGATIYVSGDNRSTGRWDVQGDQYCSEWPPSDRWSCYDISAENTGGVTTITWIGGDGSRETARLVPKG